MDITVMNGGGGAPEHAIARAQLNFKDWIENKAAPWAGIILIVSLVARSASAWSFGAFSIAAFPAPLRSAFDSMTGLGVALAMELLMSAAGAQWWRIRREAARAPYDLSIPKAERQATAAALASDVELYKRWTIFGALASIGGGMFFAVTTIAHPTAVTVGLDGVLSLAIGGGVFFFGVIYEQKKPDHNRQAQEAVEGRLNDQALTLAGQVASGDVRPEQVAFLKGVVSPSIARRLDALMPRDGALEYWDTPRIAAWLGDTSDAAQRDIRRKLQRSASDPASGVRQKRTGRGLEAPQTAILGLFQREIERRMRLAPGETLTGESAAQTSDQAPDGVSGAGHRPDETRRMSAPQPTPDAPEAPTEVPDWLARMGVS